MLLVVEKRLFKGASHPPTNFQVYPDNTLLTHTDQHGGEQRVDLIHYREDRVVYIEATVSDYHYTKIPGEGARQKRTAVVLNSSLEKWLGAEIFKVSVRNKPSADQRLQSAQQELVVAYKSKSNKFRPQPPELIYIVATTCPVTCKLNEERVNRHNWIAVCFLEDLVASGLTPGI